MTAEPAPENQQTTRPSQLNSPHPEKRPAKGMEDVVHLFLTQSPETTAISPAAGEVPSGREPTIPSHRILTVACPAAALGKAEIVQLLNENTAALETGMRAIDRAVPCDLSRTIDLLAIDSLNQLVLIALETASYDGILLRAVSQYDWILRHVPIFRKLYQGQVINFSSPPRVFLVAPEFSQQLTSAAHGIQSPRIECFRYHALAVPSGPAVYFERA